MSKPEQETMNVDQAAGDAAPKPTTAEKVSAVKKATSSTSKRGPGRPSKDEALAKKLAEKIAGVFGSAATMMGQLEPTDDGSGFEVVQRPGTVAKDCAIIAAQAEPFAAALVKLSASNPALRRWLESLSTAGELSSFASVLGLGIVLPIMGNHGVLPDAWCALLGVEPPPRPEPEPEPELPPDVIPSL